MRPAGFGAKAPEKPGQRRLRFGDGPGVEAIAGPGPVDRPPDEPRVARAPSGAAKRSTGRGGGDRRGRRTRSRAGRPGSRGCGCGPDGPGPWPGPRSGRGRVRMPRSSLGPWPLLAG
ncbi:MAG: hypothetical protein MZV63_66020 [Marinilabiliales bacterium]|nr:hypothetical protein [Marinilabiliales bacterium]